jgi:hypothetical protein
MDEDRKHIKELLQELGPKPGRVAINIACFLAIPPMGVMVLLRGDTARIALILLAVFYLILIPIASFLEIKFNLVTKFLRTKLGNLLFCR